MVRVVIALLLLTVLPATAWAQAEKRVALVIGNSAYQHTSKLTNPFNDAADVAAELKKLGFRVIDGFDLEKAAFDRKVRDFATALKGADAGVFFYAGHGLQAGGHNYLVPIDAKAESEEALDFEMLRIDVVHRAMERSTKTNILFLDACRDNPLARNLARAMGTRSTQIGKGLATIESGVGTLISFSTHPGAVALDGAGRNSPFTAALLKYISAPTGDLGTILISVRNDVMRQTRDQQVPWEHSALRGRFYFNPAAQAAEAAKAERAKVEIAVGARPSTYSATTAKGLFTEEHAKVLQSLVEKHRLPPLPDVRIEIPDADVPSHLRRFVGIWHVPANGGRTDMIIATRVDKDGKLDGYWLWGPPGPSSPSTQRPAGIFRIAGGYNWRFATV